MLDTSPEVQDFVPVEADESDTDSGDLEQRETRETPASEQDSIPQDTSMLEMDDPVSDTPSETQNIFSTIAEGSDREIRYTDLLQTETMVRDTMPQTQELEQGANTAQNLEINATAIESNSIFETRTRLPISSSPTPKMDYKFIHNIPTSRSPSPTPHEFKDPRIIPRILITPPSSLPSSA